MVTLTRYQGLLPSGDARAFILCREDCVILKLTVRDIKLIVNICENDIEVYSNILSRKLTVKHMKATSLIDIYSREM